jgi:DNA-binding NarL/FixJ family response regulator
MQSMNEPIKVLVLHADPVAQAGLAYACARDDGLDVIEAADGMPDVVVADYANALAAANRHKVLVVGASDREWDIRRLLERGVRGYVLSCSGLEEIAEGVRAVHRGSRFLSPQAAARLAESVYREPLTAREEEVLRLVSHGLPNKTIANKLGIAAGTVKSHLKSTFGKLNVQNRTQAAALVEQHGLLERTA